MTTLQTCDKLRLLITVITAKQVLTRSKAIAKGLSDVPCQFKSCQLLHSCTENSILEGLQ